MVLLIYVRFEMFAIIKQPSTLVRSGVFYIKNKLLVYGEKYELQKV